MLELYRATRDGGRAEWSLARVLEVFPPPQPGELAAELLKMLER